MEFSGSHLAESRVAMWVAYAKIQMRFLLAGRVLRSWKPPEMLNDTFLSDWIEPPPPLPDPNKTKTP